MFFIHAEPRIAGMVVRGSVFFYVLLDHYIGLTVLIFLINTYICINHIKKIITIFF